jgi:hypothetical protein
MRIFVHKFSLRFLGRNCLKKRGADGKMLLNYISEDVVNGGVDCNGVPEDVTAVRSLMLTTI